MDDFLPGQHYRHVRFGDVVMIVGLATEEVTLRKLVVYTDRGVFGDGVWVVPLEIFEHRYELVDDGKELRPVIDSKNIVDENEEFSSWVKRMNMQMALKILQVNQLVRERDSLQRRISYLEQQIEELEK